MKNLDFNLLNFVSRKLDEKLVVFLLFFCPTIIFGQVNFNNNTLPSSPSNGFNSAIGVNNTVGTWNPFGTGSSFALAVGFGNQITATSSFAMGNHNQVSGKYSFGFGLTNTISGEYSFGFGNSISSHGNYTYVLGSSSQANNQYAMAFGTNLRANASASMVIGYGSSNNSSLTLENNIANSLMIGFFSDKPTLFVGPSSGAGTIGKVGIGTTATPNTLPGNIDITDYSLYVKGGILTEEVRVRSGWADYVFLPDYDLKSLDEVEKHINTFGHLPNVPSQQVVEESGLELGEITKIQQEKIEELTLYIIDLQKQINALKNDIETTK